MHCNELVVHRRIYVSGLTEVAEVVQAAASADSLSLSYERSIKQEARLRRRLVLDRSRDSHSNQLKATDSKARIDLLTSDHCVRSENEKSGIKPIE